MKAAASTCGTSPKDLHLWDPRFLVPAVLGPAALMFIDIEWSFDYGASGLIGFVWVSMLLAGVATLTWGLLARRRTGLIVGAYLLLMFGVVFVVPGELGAERKAKSIHVGDKIASALSSFSAEHDHYPASLADLVPKYLSEIPTTGMGVLHDVPFRYRLSDAQGYSLSFPAPRWIDCFYRLESVSWVCND